MRRTFLALVALVAALVAFPVASSSGALSSRSVISARGVGPIHIGMTIAQAERRLGHGLRVERFNPPCGTARLSGRLRSYVLLTGQRIAYISVRSPRLRTDRGVRVGDPVSTLIARYSGRLKAHPNIYTQEPQYEYVAGRRKLIFFTQDGRIDEITTGRKPEVNYVEGCA
jgi:hypothetical protein